MICVHFHVIPIEDLLGLLGALTIQSSQIQNTNVCIMNRTSHLSTWTVSSVVQQPRLVVLYTYTRVIYGRSVGIRKVFSYNLCLYHNMSCCGTMPHMSHLSLMKGSQGNPTRPTRGYWVLLGLIGKTWLVWALMTCMNAGKKPPLSLRASLRRPLDWPHSPSARVSQKLGSAISGVLI